MKPIKLRIYNDGPIKQVYFKFDETTKGLKLTAVDIKGNPVPKGDILCITENGLCLHTDIEKDIGLPLDSNGVLKIDATC